MAEKDKDMEKIKELLQIMRDNDLVEIEINHGDDKIFLKRCLPQQHIDTLKQRELDEREKEEAERIAAIRIRERLSEGEPRAPQQQENLIEIKSPIVGTFYQTPSPDSEPYVQIGSHVEPQTLVCIIEAMKVMNEIKAETTGMVAQICVTNGEAVEYGQVLFRLRPD
jgi:acetyl-CoA carboxylase biotin carboxyl carrier protein